jgi:hypothetical protein
MCTDTHTVQSHTQKYATRMEHHGKQQSHLTPRTHTHTQTHRVYLIEVHLVRGQGLVEVWWEGKLTTCTRVHVLALEELLVVVHRLVLLHTSHHNILHISIK